MIPSVCRPGWIIGIDTGGGARKLRRVERGEDERASRHEMVQSINPVNRKEV
jgi:hypothetical protein